MSIYVLNRSFLAKSGTKEEYFLIENQKVKLNSFNDLKINGIVNATNNISEIIESNIEILERKKEEIVSNIVDENSTNEKDLLNNYVVISREPGEDNSSGGEDCNLDYIRNLDILIESMKKFIKENK